MAYPRLIQILSDLIRTESVNPAYDAQSSESEIQKQIARYFRDHSVETCEQEALPGRSNVIAKLPGRDTSRRIVFEAHCDTAGVSQMTILPFHPEIRDGRIYGRGACDTKAGLAAMMQAIVDLKQTCTVPPCDIWVASTIDEEHTYRGVLKLCEGLQAAAAVVSEPTNVKMAVASKGCLRWRITVKGRAAHSSMPGLGINAIEHMAWVVQCLGDHRVQLQKVCHPLVGSPTLNVGLIQGGTQVNNVPEACWIEIDRRLVPGEQPESVLSSYRDLLHKLQAARPVLDWSMEPLLQDEPMQTPVNSMIATSAREALKAAGLDGSPVGVPFGSDASKFARAGIPSIIMGPGSIEQAHTADEYVELEEVEKAFVVYRKLMTSFG